MTETPTVYQGVYVNPSDCADPALKITPAHCQDADGQIGIVLLGMGLTADEIDSLTLPNPALLAVGKSLACAQAALEASRGDDSAMMGKHKAYADKARALIGQLSRPALGLVSGTGAGGGLGSIKIGRG